MWPLPIHRKVQRSAAVQCREDAALTTSIASKSEDSLTSGRSRTSATKSCSSRLDGAATEVGLWGKASVARRCDAPLLLRRFMAAFPRKKGFLSQPSFLSPCTSSPRRPQVVNAHVHEVQALWSETSMGRAVETTSSDNSTNPRGAPQKCTDHISQRTEQRTPASGSQPQAPHTYGLD
jgi:hypothetical protein